MTKINTASPSKAVWLLSIMCGLSDSRHPCCGGGGLVSDGLLMLFSL